MTPRLTLHGDATRASPVIVIHPATAVSESVYTPFATYLAAQGFRVVTYNYRGVGADARNPASRRLRMRDWADHDVNAVIGEIRQRFPDAPLAAIGHSFGGHAIGLSEQSKALRAGVLIASPVGSLRFVRPWSERLKATMLLHGLGPLSVAAFGYAPGKRLGVSEDLCAGVLHEWRRWTSLRQYFFDDPSLGAAERFARVGYPILSYGFDDDPWATEPAIAALLRRFSGTSVTHRQIDPAQAGSGPIGHMGFFRSRHRQTLWPPVAAWLHAVLDPPAR